MKQKGGPSKQSVKKSIAYQALERISSIYALEDDWKELSPEERLSRRQEHSKPLVEAYFAWVKGIDPATVISENTRKGLTYSVKQEKYLKVYLEDGRVPIDNSASERAIRPFCVGRANWHIIGSINGAWPVRQSTASWRPQKQTSSSSTSISNSCWRKSQKTRTRAIILSWIHCFLGRIQSQLFVKSRVDLFHQRRYAVGVFFSVPVIYRVPLIPSG